MLAFRIKPSLFPSSANRLLSIPLPVFQRHRKQWGWRMSMLIPQECGGWIPLYKTSNINAGKAGKTERLQPVQSWHIWLSPITKGQGKFMKGCRAAASQRSNLTRAESQVRSGRNANSRWEVNRLHSGGSRRPYRRGEKGKHFCISEPCLCM